jgi:hypothetical protein
MEVKNEPKIVVQIWWKSYKKVFQDLGQNFPYGGPNLEEWRRNGGILQGKCMGALDFWFKWR